MKQKRIDSTPYSTSAVPQPWAKFPKWSHGRALQKLLCRLYLPKW